MTEARACQAVPIVYILVGATASGKTEVALRLAEVLGAEPASLDSMKVYRGMDIGTAKPSARERASRRWHLLDLAEPSADYSVGLWLTAAEEAIAEAAARGKPLIFEGGSPLYYRALTEGLFPGPARQPEVRAELEARAAECGVEALHAELAAVDPRAAERIQRRDLRRIVRALEVHRLTGRPISEQQRQFGARRRDLDFRVAGLERSRQELYARIDARVGAMMTAGFLEEVRGLLHRHGALSLVAMQALGYRQLAAHLAGEASLERARYLTRRDTRHFARRQINWFRRLPGIEWFPWKGAETAESVAGRIAEFWQRGAAGQPDAAASAAAGCKARPARPSRKHRLPGARPENPRP